MHNTTSWSREKREVIQYKSTYSSNCIYTESKKQDTKLLPTSPNIKTIFKLFFADRLGSKFATKSCLNIPLCLKHVATLPCEIWMSEKWCQSQICIVINDKTQGSIAKHLRNDELLYYTFVIQSASERIFKTDEHLAKLQAKWLIVACTPFALHFCHQRCWSHQISWITCVLRMVNVTDRCYVNRQINVSLLSTDIKLL